MPHSNHPANNTTCWTAGGRRAAVLLACSLVVTLAGCASRVDPMAITEGHSPVQLQNRLLLTPANGGQRIAPADLKAGDIILSNTAGFVSTAIRAVTVAPVSHASLYLGDDRVAEAVGSGVRIRPVADFMADESTMVAFRHPGLTPAHAEAMRRFAQAQDGKKYNTFGIVLHAPFTLQRQYCELPLIPGLVRDFCIRGLAAIQLGAARNDRFFCSQFVLEAYQQARLPLTSADPLLVSPADLLHMREGDVPSVRTEQTLLYVGHLKAGPAVVETEVAARQPD